MDDTTLNTLQSLITERGYDAYLVPRADMFFGEEVRPCDERLRAISGFGGSAGLAVVRANRQHVLLVDGRYSVQATADLAGQPWNVQEGGLDHMAAELAGKTIAYDPWLFTPDQLAALSASTLVADPDNLVDQVWVDRPVATHIPAYDLPMELVGESSAAKCARIAEACEGRSLLITHPSALAWLMNQRGSDLPTTPVKVAFGLLSAEGQVQTFAPDARDALLAALDGLWVQYDPAITSAVLINALGDRGQAKPCPIQSAKAVKNEAEIAAMKQAHEHDGQALTAFLDWFAAQDKTDLSELDVVAKLAVFREQVPGYIGPSFETICGSGPNGALPHYCVNTASNRQFAHGDLIVLDSGGQYPGATTDVTRTLAVGTVSEARRRHFTLVLKGMIALTLQRFPVGTTGHQLDVLARAALWNAGLNYNHGTGHGVGAGLSVHESPPNVSPRARMPAGNWALSPGMIFSNEPGYYQEGSHGIRCENLMLVVEVSAGWLGLETLTKAPFDTDLVIWDLLSSKEADWLQTYQRACRPEEGNDTSGELK